MAIIYPMVLYIYIYTVPFHYGHFDSDIYIKMLSVPIRYNMGLIVLLELELTAISYPRICFQAGRTPSIQRRQNWSRGALEQRECHTVLN
jgi:hypothetical protein